MQAAHTLCTYSLPYNQRGWLLMTPWMVSLLFSLEGTASVILAKFPPLALVNHGLLIIPIHLIDSMTLSLLSTCSWCVVSARAPVVLWQPSHHPSGCCTLVMVEERLPPHTHTHYCKALWVYKNTQSAI